MNWESFKVKASKVNKRYFFKKTFEGYEVWDVAQVYGHGFPRKYRIMVLPFGTNSQKFNESVNHLKIGEWNRRLSKQELVVKRCIESGKTLADFKKAQFAKVANEIGRSMRSQFKKVADELGISETALRLKMKDVSWDDTKKVLRKQMEARGAYQ